MADPAGPVVTGGFEVLVIQDEARAGHTLFVLPDHHTDALQRERKIPSAATSRKGCVLPVPRPQRLPIPLPPLRPRLRRKRCGYFGKGWRRGGGAYGR
jgi:hypothetical protein